MPVAGCCLRAKAVNFLTRPSTSTTSRQRAVGGAGSRVRDHRDAVGGDGGLGFVWSLEGKSLLGLRRREPPGGERGCDPRERSKCWVWEEAGKGS